VRYSAPLLLFAALAGALIGAPACGGGQAGEGEHVPPPRFEAQHPVYLEDDLGFDRDGIAARQSRVEARIRDCMRAHGFRYIPVEPLEPGRTLPDAPRLNDDDFVLHFGYGISTLWGRPERGRERNLRIRAALPPLRRGTYDRTLWGRNVGATFQMAADSGDFTALGGCTRSATAAIFSGMDVLTRLVHALDALDERVAADPRMVAALGRWRDCMAAAGLPYKDPDAIDRSFLRRMRAIVGPIAGPFATTAADGGGTRPTDPRALASLQHEERATAARDLGCERRYVRPVEGRVRPPYEAAFRRAHRSLIRRVKPVR
jgi:hypothetical protein